jgi:hypothetical protein
MIYLVVRLAKNSTSAGIEVCWPEDANQIWLDPTPHCDEESQAQMLEDDFDNDRVQWYRCPRIAYVLRDP